MKYLSRNVKHIFLGPKFTGNIDVKLGEMMDGSGYYITMLRPGNTDSDHTYHDKYTDRQASDDETLIGTLNPVHLFSWNVHCKHISITFTIGDTRIMVCLRDEWPQEVIRSYLADKFSSDKFNKSLPGNIFMNEAIVYQMFDHHILKKCERLVIHVEGHTQFIWSNKKRKLFASDVSDLDDGTSAKYVKMVLATLHST